MAPTATLKKAEKKNDCANKLTQYQRPDTEAFLHHVYNSQGKGGKVRATSPQIRFSLEKLTSLEKQETRISIHNTFYF